ncbi:hypothetical protein CRI93_06940 [Longimonas halophila]|uniref:Secretion system C-terminal sorting domain-containing protein n=2 Tax=Longimonas halophila TaxID=1469170 RepID=A0A2H3P634_9BACT|nr:hypothetical protein CRI93_06940 [Longimonas halophila]
MPLFLSPRRRASIVQALLCSLMLIVVWAATSPPDAQAQLAPDRDLRVENQIPFEQVMSYNEVCGIENDPRNMETFLVSDTVVPKNEQANITVNYGAGFTPQAQEAFQRAIDVWRTHISTPVEIRIDASYQSQDANTLASAGPRFLYELTDNNNNSFIIGDALADALLGSDQNPGEPDIIVNVNSGRNDWHFGENEPGPAEIDFTSVILHEIGHGLNFLNLGGVENGEGSLGIEQLPGVPGILSTGIVHEDPPGTFNSVLNESLYPNPSTALGDALASNALFFTGETTDLAAQTSTGPVPAQLYAPNPYQGGSSIAHFDESAYPAGDPNALMTPQVGFNEVARVPGPNMCGLLADLGWTLNEGCLQSVGSTVFAFQAAARSESGNATLSWNTGPDASEIDEYIITTRRFGEAFGEERLTAGSAGSRVVFPVEDLPMGRYTFELSWIRNDGTPSDVTITTGPVEINAYNIAAAVEGAPNSQGRAPVAVNWQLPPDASNFRFEVERAAGVGRDNAEFEVISDMPMSGTDAQFQNQAAGQYLYRIRATDDAGNVLFSEPVEAEIPFDAPVVFTEAYPNPTSGPFRFDVTAESAQSVDVEVYNTIGQRVYSNRVGLREDVARTVTIDGSRWASGTYFVRISGGDFTETRRVALVR